jgi:hypothetical protein
MCIIVLLGLQRMMREGRAAPALISVFCILLFVQQSLGMYRVQTGTLRQMRSIATLLRHTGNQPLVLSEFGVLHQLSFYGRRDLVNRLVYLADPYRSVRYLGHDTVDRGLLALVPWFPLKIMWWHEWWRTHPYSLIYGGVGEWTWATYAADSVGTVQVLNRDVSHLMLGVTRTKMPDDDRTASDPPGKPMLYDQVADGPPLCKLYMPTETCPVVDDPNFTTPIITYPELRVPDERGN